jgi:hypothetical protein
LYVCAIVGVCVCIFGGGMGDGGWWVGGGVVSGVP